MIRTAALNAICKRLYDASKLFCVSALILGLALWLHVYVKNLVSIVEWNMNVYLVATPALSWLAYREYNTNLCGSNLVCKRALEGNRHNNKNVTGFGCERHDQANINSTRATHYVAGSNGYDRLTHANDRGLPDDALIHICSFLHPRDITSLSCVNRSLHKLVDGRNFICNNDNCNVSDDTDAKFKWKTDKSQAESPRIHTASNQLWKSLWYRDYGHVLLGWHVGRKALWRSLEQPMHVTSPNSDVKYVQRREDHSDVQTNDDENAILRLSILLAQKLDTITDMKYFYFSFLETYLDYVLAGQNTPELCLLGMHGHIFDFTQFAEHHPGLAEPIRMECGKDATQYFEDLPHSSVARKIARKLCVIVDRACLMNHPQKSHGVKGFGPADIIGCGLCRAPALQWSVENSNSRPPQVDARETRFGLDRVIPKTSYTTKIRANSLRFIRDLFHREQMEKNITANGYLSTGIFFTRDGFGGIIGKRSQYQRHSDMHPDGQIHVFYDPFDQRWKSW